MAEQKFTVPLQKMIDEFKLEIIYVPKDPNEILIDENDVTAGHAASIGQVDPEDMYYLMSRGLDQHTAERLVVRGFLGSVIVEIPVKEVRDEMIATIEEKLSQR